MSKNKRNGGHQAPAQQHAEGQHGRKTIEFLRKQHVEQSGSASADAGPRHDPDEIREHGTPANQASAKRKGS